MTEVAPIVQHKANRMSEQGKFGIQSRRLPGVISKAEKEIKQVGKENKRYKRIQDLADHLADSKMGTCM